MNGSLKFAALLVAWTILVAGCASQPEQSEAFTVGRNYSFSSGDNAKYEDTASVPRLNEQSELSDYLTYAALNNPGLEAAFNRWKAALERVPQAKSLPDPKFTYRYFMEQVETRVGAQRQAFGIAQMLPWFGKLELKGGAALDAAHAARQRYEAAKLNAALNRPAESPLPWPQQLEEEGVSFTDRQLLKWMADSNPELRALEFEIAKSGTEVDLARKDYYPDVMLGIDFIDTADVIGVMSPSDSGQDPVIATFSQNVPVWR